MKVSQIMAALKVDGWYLVATRGSHRQFKHPVERSRYRGEKLHAGLIR